MKTVDSTDAYRDSSGDPCYQVIARLAAATISSGPLATSAHEGASSESYLSARKLLLLARLFIALTVFPLIELTLLLLLGKYTNIWVAVGFVVITALIGAILLRWQGWQAWRRVQEDLRNGRMPTASLLDGFLVLLASALLISPGVLTDLVGITLLIPWCRRGYALLLMRYLKGRFLNRSSVVVGENDEAPGGNGRTCVIDSHVVESPRQSD